MVNILYKYQKAQARRAVQLYYASLTNINKNRLYKEFSKPNIRKFFFGRVVAAENFGFLISCKSRFAVNI